MLSRLNLPVTVATLLVASVCGTGVSHAGQVGERCYPDDPVLRAGQTVGDVQADLVFHPPISVDGVPGKVMIPPGQGDFRYSLCEGRVLAADEVSKRCTRSNVVKTHLGCIVDGGTQSSFAFRVPPGQTLPEGREHRCFGILHVDAGARLAQADIRICVSQLNAVNDSCQNIGVNQTPTITPALTPGGGNAGDLVVPLAVAGGAGVGGYYLLNQYMPGFGFLGGSCSPADPTPAQVCFGGNSGSSACQSAQSQQNSFCQCEGFSGFDNRTGGCQ